MSVSLLPKTRLQAYTPGQPARPPTAQVTRVYLQPAQVIPGSLWTITIIDADGGIHVATYQSLTTDGQTEIIDGIMVAFNPGPADYFFSKLVVSADYDNRFITIVSPGYIIVQATVTPPSSKWSFVAFPYALIDPVVRGAYADALREQGQPDKAEPEEQAVVQEQAIRQNAYAGKQFDGLSDQQIPHNRYGHGEAK